MSQKASVFSRLDPISRRRKDLNKQEAERQSSSISNSKGSCRRSGGGSGRIGSGGARRDKTRTTVRNKTAFKHLLAARIRMPTDNWIIRDYNTNKGLAIVRDTLHAVKSGILPERYACTKYPIYDITTLECVCSPIPMHQLFVLPQFPTRRKETYSTPNVDCSGVRFEHHEKTSYLDLDLDKMYFQYCYEGKYFRAYRYRGVTHVSPLNHIDVTKCVENDVLYVDVLKQCAVDIESLFDERYDFCDTIVHFVMGFPTACVRTRREVIGSYIVLVRLEKMKLHSSSSAPLRHGVLEGLLHQDHLSEPLGSAVGRILKPLDLTADNAAPIFDGFGGQQLMVRDRRSGNVIGKIWSGDAFTISRLKPEAIAAKGIAVDCFRRSSEKNREALILANNFPGLLNFRMSTLADFSLDPTESMKLVDGSFTDECHTNWELLSTVCYLYLPNMRKCIAENAYAIQKELALLKDLLLSNNYPVDEKVFDYEDFDFSAIVSMVESHYLSNSKLKSLMKITTPSLFNLMRPKCEDRALEPSYTLPDYDADTYASRGAPEIKKRIK